MLLLATNVSSPRSCAVSDISVAIFLLLHPVASALRRYCLAFAVFRIRCQGVFLAEPISNLIGGNAAYVTMRMTVYRKIERSISQSTSQ